MPIEVSGVGAFGESKEVAQLTLLLRTLSDPQDAVSLVGTLRGPLFGISDPELFAWQQSGGWFSILLDETGSAFPASPRFRRSRQSSHAHAERGGIRTSAVRSIRRHSSSIPQRIFRLTRVLPAARLSSASLEQSGYLALAATNLAALKLATLHCRRSRAAGCRRRSQPG